MKSKNNLHEYIYGLGLTLVKVFLIVLLAISVFSTLTVNYYAEDMNTQQRIAHHTLAANLLLCALLLGFIMLILRLFRYRIARAPKPFLFVTGAVLSVLGLLLVVFGLTTPSADAASVLAIGEAFSKGDYSAIHPTGSYLSFYPQQIGLAFYFDILLRLFSLLPKAIASIHLLKCCNILCALVIMYYLYKISFLMFDSLQSAICCLLLTCLNLPLIFYTSFIYSELPSFAFLSAGLFYFLSYLKEGSYRGNTAKFLSLVLFSFSVLLRKNSLVILIAVLLVALLEGFLRKNSSFLLYSLVLIVLCLNILPLVQKIYETKAGNTLKSGVPAVNYFAMGMQESSRGNGWYNGFNFNTYLESGTDSEKSAQISKEAIRNRWQYFKETPGSALSFYREKYLTQWTDGSYFCREATISSYDGRSSFFKEIYDGKYSSLFMNYCNAYQLLLYAGALMGIVHGILSKSPKGKAENSLAFYLCGIGVLGGFFFHMIWEANSRYLLLYSFLLLPYCGRGITYLIGFFHPREKDF